jgi:hypothetical protein
MRRFTALMRRLATVTSPLRTLANRWAGFSEFRQIFTFLLVSSAIALALTLVFDAPPDTAIAVGLGIVGVLALVYANHQFRDAKDTITQLNAVATELTFIRAQLTTEQLAHFPHFVAQVVTIMGHARDNIAIFCDYPTYGSWISPDGYKRYLYTISRTEATIRLICLNEWRRTQLARERLATPVFDALRSDPNTADFLAAYADQVADHRPVPSLGSMTREQFVAILEDANKSVLRTHFVRGEERQAWETDLFMPLFFWIADGAEAVFALAPLGDLRQPPLAFRTRDVALIDALSTVFEGYIRVQSSTEKHDQNRTGLIGFAGALAEWRALLRSTRDCEEEAVRLRSEIQTYVSPRALG